MSGTARSRELVLIHKRKKLRHPDKSECILQPLLLNFAHFWNKIKITEIITKEARSLHAQHAFFPADLSVYQIIFILISVVSLARVVEHLTTMQEVEGFSLENG